MFKKWKIITILLIILGIAGVYLYFKYYFTYEQKNVLQRKIETITGQNLTITVFGFDGRVIKRWEHVEKISSGKDLRAYTFFYTQDNKYVQLPDSVWYIAEEE